MHRWEVAYDAGRPEGRPCRHLSGARAPGAEPVRPASAPAGPRASGCPDCLASGQRWVHLRACLTCGNVGCCDSSPGRHAWSHAARTGHPLARSAEKGEVWAWCYEDEVFLVPSSPGAPAQGPTEDPTEGGAPDEGRL
ncbi:UBP-type zinc finger domain-containing protein [Streptomyces sp. NPDC058655]|uniref:UBP-type zinc finger domain-containing protein n=1 Tax=Streptomyces sp. NPDC058655 TaxID=3346577 RepID=UPI0036531A22